MVNRIKTALIYAIVALAWAVLIDSMIDTFRAPMPSLSQLIEPIGRFLPFLVILAVTYAFYRVWSLFKSGLRRAAAAFRPGKSIFGADRARDSY